MANTVIALKKSGTPSATPVDLANGELAINYADGKLFYKSAAGSIQEISGGGGGNAFGTVNANGTLVVADTPGDVLTLVPGNNITITADAITDTITISAISSGSDIGPAYDQANAAYDKANAANVLAYDTGIGANAFTSATIAGANAAVGAGANSYADIVGTSANTFTSATIAGANTTVGAGANSYAAAVGTSANAYLLTIIAGANAAVGAGANTVGSAAFDKANTAETIAIAAYANSNTKLSTSGGTITGDLALVGNLTVSGNTSYVSVQNYRVDDPLIYLAANNYVSDIVDIGFIANYVNATGSNVHTGLMRDHQNKEYYLFYGYDQEPINNHVDPNGNNFTIAVLNADIRTSNLVLGGQNAITWITAAYDQANVGGSGGGATISETPPGSPTAGSFWWNSNTGKLLIYYTDVDGSQWVDAVATGASGSDAAANLNLIDYVIAQGVSAYTQANTAYNQANLVFGQANTAYNQANTAYNQANTAYNQANLVFAQANAAYNQANTALKRATSSALIFGG